MERMMDADLKVTIWLALATIIVAAVIIYLTHDTTTGTLYLNDTRSEVCHGILKTKKAYSTTYTFVCDDGTVINNPTNFTIR
jgi:hypothetical protein